MRILTGMVLLLLGIDVPAFAESPSRTRVYQPPRRELARPRTPERRLASRTSGRSGLRVKVEYEDKEPSVMLRFGLVGGLSLVSAQTSTNGGAADKASGQAPNLGLLVDLTLWQYLGIEADTYYGLGGEIKDSSGQSSKVQSYAGLVNLKVQYPFVGEGLRFVPKAGVGYGYASAKTSFQNEGSLETTLSGPYATVGFEFEPIVNWFLIADYAQTFSASGQLKASGTGEDGQEFSSAKIERIRASVLYRVVPRFLVGGQFVRRTFSYAFGSSGTDVTNTLEQNQVLGVFLYEL